MKCPKCNTKNPEEARFCMECGMPLEKPTTTCPHCDTLNPSTAKFCLECGEKLEDIEVEEKEEESPREVEYIPPNDSASWREFCPVCNQRPLTIKTYKGILSHKTLLECDYCGAVFEPKGKKFKFKSIYDISSDIWKKYGGKTLTEEEWTRIAHGGISNEEQRQLEEKTAQNNLVNFVNALNQGTINLAPILNPPLILKKNEEACVVLGDIIFMEPRAVRKTRGGYAGPTIRVAKGVSFRMGSLASQSESHEELRNIDQGTLVLTNKRLIFIGSKRTTNIDLRKIISITSYKDGIASQRENKQKTEYFTGIDHHTLTFQINGRSHTVPFTGLVMKAAIEGKIKQILNQWPSPG